MTTSTSFPCPTSAPSATEKETIELSGLLVGALDSYRPRLAARDIALDEEIPANADIRIFGDAERLHQLLANLLDNVLKYTEEGGRLAIRLTVNGGMAVLDLEDSAPGVPEAELAKLFYRLYRVENSRSRATGGAGLGLAICRNIVEAHSGKISALPSLLGGVLIRIVLPVEDARR